MSCERLALIMNEVRRHKKDMFTDHLRLLREALDCMGISKGRAKEYPQLIEEFYKDGGRTKEHILAYSESCEIRDIYEFWKPHIDDFPGLVEKIRTVFSKGPVLQEGENPGISSNRPRNDAFVYFMAGILLRAEIRVVVVDGVVALEVECHQDADMTFQWNDSFIDVECKRPQTEKMLEERTKEAYEQINNKGDRKGIIAIDCSVLIRPAGSLLEDRSAEDAHHSISKHLEKVATPKVTKYLAPNILGFILFARVPAMLQIAKSPILDFYGKPITRFERNSISSFLIISNKNIADPRIFASIFEKIKRSM